jgi:exodeoxyribonuclease VII large subunit
MQEVSAGPQVYGVGDVVAGVKQLLEDRVGRLWVVGEVRNLSRPRSGHIYFTLADERGQLRAALFRGNARRLAFEPEEGLEVLVYGDLTVYEPRGDLQLLVRQLEPRGAGALQLAFEQLRRRLEAEGLFAPQRKRPLPAYPERIGVVTSPTGAALRDVLEVTGRRWPGIPILLAPTRVQGLGAEREIAAALTALSRQPGVSLVLLVRGGGSLEDLQPFNTEEVARAIVDSPIPVVAGVGHEVDVTIADLAADVRAATPSAAAELAIPEIGALVGALRARWQRLERALRSRMQSEAARLAGASTALRAQSPAARLALRGERLAAAGRALGAAVRARIERGRRRLGEAGASLGSLSPLAVLSRGYGIVQRASDGAIVRAVGDVQPGDALAIRVDRAELVARVEAIRDRSAG